MWGIIPAAGKGSRIQPLAFSKELLPVGSRSDGVNERPMAVSEYLIERMIIAGADKICIVISPGKSDIIEYFGGKINSTYFSYVVQPVASGLCDAVFTPIPLIANDEQVLVGLPDTIWFPDDGYKYLPDDKLSFLLFPVNNPELFDAVVTTENDIVSMINVKSGNPGSKWVWGCFKMPGRILHELYALWNKRDRADEYFGTLINAYISEGGKAYGIKAGEAYVDVGTIFGYREAMRLLSQEKVKDEGFKSIP